MSTTKPVSKPESGSLVPARNGGRIRHGSQPGTNAGGSGRPPDAIRAALREIAADKAAPFLASLFNGTVKVTFAGTCPNCKQVTDLPTDAEALRTLLDRATSEIAESIGNRLKASDQSLKYGIGTKDEVTLVSPEVKARLARTVEVITQRCGELAPDILRELDAVWTE